MKLAARMDQLLVESAFDVLVKARALEAQGRDIIHLEIGEPDFPTPPHVVEAGKQALDQGWTHYGAAQGDPELRTAIAEHIKTTRSVQVTADQICVTPGGKPILFFAMLALLEPGDEAIYPDPGFPIYESVIRFLGGVPVPIPLEEQRGFSFDVNLLASKITDRTKLLILNSPQNPTGGVIPKCDIQAIAALVRDRNLMVLSDEIYSRIVYGPAPHSILQEPGMSGKTILLDGFSKIYAMTGWRLGYGVMSAELASAIGKLMVNSNSCTASFTQRAGIAALRGPQNCASAMVAEFHQRRDAFCDRLNTLPGFRCARPDGAFYAFPNILGTGYGSKELADLLLSEAGVACLDGATFGAHGNGYLRFSYANSTKKLMEAADRIERFLRR